MKNMMISDMEKKDNYQTSVLYDQSSYPYGLKIQLDAESYRKLGLGEPPKIGSKMMLLAHVEVCSIYKEPSKGDDHNYSMGLQITEMDLKPHEENKEETAESVMYGEG